MNAIVKSAPQVISDNVENEMTPNFAETCARMRKEARPTKNIPWCQQYINIGVFFDGTDNNRIRDEPLKSHTNIVKLFNAHKSADGKGWLKVPGHYRIYVPGLGTRFPENREWRETMEGKAFGKGGQARILFALLEVYNSVYNAFNSDAPLFNNKDIAAKLQQYTQDIDTGDPLRDAHAPRPDRRSWFDPLSKKLDTALREARTKRPLPQIPLISLSVFGFSRGATLARAFCYWFNDLLVKDKTFA
ncbi:phospholipase effector Tle1 domain-containing protein, partial [Glaciimonas immobilis]